VAGVQRADQVTGPHRLALGHRRRNRLVRGAQTAGVVDTDHPTAGHLTREPDRASAGRVDRRTSTGRQVDAAVAGQPGLRRRIEPAHHRRVPVERPAKAAPPGDRRTKTAPPGGRHAKAAPPGGRHAKAELCAGQHATSDRRQAGCGQSRQDRPHPTDEPDHRRDCQGCQETAARAGVRVAGSR
jgi:hypothetical protein